MDLTNDILENQAIESGTVPAVTTVSSLGSSASMVTMTSQATATKPSPSVWFTAEIQQMMHGFGDCRKPLVESAMLIEQIVREQVLSALYRAEETAKCRNARFIGIEDFLFLLRRDKVKLRRLLKYMELKDLKKTVWSQSVESECLDGQDSDPLRPQPRKRAKLCMDFISAIDPSGELVRACEAGVDEVKHDRMVRAETAARGMDDREYMDFCAARQASFVGRYKSQKFKDWLLHGVTLDIKPNPMALETLSYLAYETLAQVMDLSLIVRRDMQCSVDPITKVVPHVMLNYSAFQQNQMLPPQNTTPPAGTSSSSTGMLKSPGSSVPNSPLNSPPVTPTTPGSSVNQSSLNASAGSVSAKATKVGKKLKKQGSGGARDLQTVGAITVAHIHEAMRRYGEQVGPFAPYTHRAASAVGRLLCA